jgi:hypothetical protein
VLRNPNNRPQTISIKLQDTFELPANAPQDYVAKSPWKADVSRTAIELHAREAQEFILAPFEVLTWM